MSDYDQFLLQRLERCEEELRELKRDYGELKEDFTSLKIDHVKAMERQSTIVNRLDRLDGGLGKLFWLVAGSAVSFVIVWLFQGGMSNLFKGE